MIKSIVAEYLKNPHWPICKNHGIERTCGDNYGDIECPFCDKVLCVEGHELKLGDQCKFCNAKVVLFRSLGAVAGTKKTVPKGK